MAVKAVKKYGKGGKLFGFLKKKDKTVAQGADKKDVRREKKQDRVAARAAAKAKRVGDRNFKRDVKSGKLKQVAPQETTTTKTIGNRTVIKTKDEDKKRKTVYSGNQASRLVTKEKQRPTKAGKDKGFSRIKDKIVERKDFSVRRKTKGTSPSGGS